MNTLLYQIPIDLPASSRERVVNLLNQQLADAIDLQLQSRQAQWNVCGPQFLLLHLFCDQVAREVEESVGEIAERVGQLGGRSLGTLRAVMEASRLPEYPVRISSGDQHIAALGRALASFVDSAREAARSTCEDRDFESAEVLVHVWQTTDRLLCMAKTYLGRWWPGIAETQRRLSSARQEEGAVA